MSLLAPDLQPRPELTCRQQIGAPLPEDEQAESATAVLARMRELLGESERRLEAGFAEEGDGERVVRERARLLDGLLAGALDFAESQLFRVANPTRGEEMALLAVGGYGRGELAPHSDVDVLFLYPYKPTPHLEQMTEFLLYRLWDLGLKVGQATRSLNECIKLAKSDLTIRTTLLETRLLWGSQRLTRELEGRFRAEVCKGHEPEFIEAKLAERDARHRRTGDSRYLLEPNIKDGKGGLRDLHTLIWLARFIYDIADWDDLVRHGVLSRAELNGFLRSRRFLWTVRCHLHYLTGRAEERLTFDLQPEIARRMGYRDRPRTLGVERFMKSYYLVAKEVGSLTRLVCAALEEQHKRRPRFALPRFGPSQRRIGGFVVQGSRLALADPKLFQTRPIAMLELFHTAQARELDIHPMALTALAQNLRRVDRQLCQSPEANRLFIEMLTSRKDPAQTLTRLNEAGVLGRLVPDFGRVVAQMQHNLYHVFTVDEHTIRVIDNLHRIEEGTLEADHPLSTRILPQLTSRTELYVAAFLHDVGKGRGGDHSEVGARIAERLGPRLGLGQAGTETVAWLVRHHLVLSNFAFKRDSEDPKTLQDLVAIVQSPERLRLLLVLTVADIRAVGPGVWNGWKGQLLRELYHEAEAAMASGDLHGRRRERIERARASLAEALLAGGDGDRWTSAEVEAYTALHDPRYWLGVAEDAHLRHARLVRRAQTQKLPLAVDFHVDEFRARTEITVYAADHPGLFMKVAGALALSGVSIVDAHIFTTADGMALDTLGVQDAERQAAVDDEARFGRIERNIRKVLQGEVWLEKELAGRRSLPPRTEVFTVEPRVLVNNQASSTHSVIEVNGRDRPGLLFALAKVLKERGLVIHSAHISTYGERVVDVFYVKDVFGLKVASPAKLKRLRNELEAALAEPADRASGKSG
ncbi:MAG: [protein-PII] uridylyltransferase [Geminicoccaceae bacterium]